MKNIEKDKLKATNCDFLSSPKLEKLALSVIPVVIGCKLYLIFPPKSKDVYSREAPLIAGRRTI
jgi:hypothetical protein